MKNKLKKGKKYKVLSAKLERVDHIHGSWFVYNWKLKLSTDNLTLKGKYTTNNDYEDLTGKTIALIYHQTEGIEFETVDNV